MMHPYREATSPLADQVEAGKVQVLREIASAIRELTEEVRREDTSFTSYDYERCLDALRALHAEVVPSGRK